MRAISEHFSNKEFRLLKEKKGKLSWHDFILTLLSDKNGRSNRQENGV